MADVAEFLNAAGDGDLPRVQKMLADGDARTTDADVNGNTALVMAMHGGSRALPTMKWLLEEGGARITERDRGGYTILLRAALRDNFTACQWLLEHGGADIAEADDEGGTVCDILFFEEDANVTALAEFTALLLVMVLKGAPPDDFVARLTRPEHVRVVEDGARLRAALPVYLVGRRTSLDDCPLLPPLLALVCGYDLEPTTEELWARPWRHVMWHVMSCYVTCYAVCCAVYYGTCYCGTLCGVLRCYEVCCASSNGSP
jgi:hypothetical protein